ncbi:MAG: TetR family transcriptional regulator [Streptosporangiales bacterium]|nr:TetR family transcriptional regulator [Streptosporangiales bacterium]
MEGIVTGAEQEPQHAGSTRRGPTRRGRPRDPHIEEIVLKATLEELAVHGFDKMSIDGVAARTGVGKPSIYRRWPNKPALATAAITLLVAREGPASTGDLVTDLSRQLLSAHRNLERSGSVPMVGLMLAEIRRHPEFIATYRKRLLEPRRATLRSLFEAARREGRIRGDADIETAVLVVMGSMFIKELAGEPFDDAAATSAVQLVVEALTPRPA